MPHLYVLYDPPLDGPTNMARDEHLLYSDLAPAVLRVYGWSPPTISLGYFQRFAELEKLPPELRRLEVVRRPTGGGAILHDREVTYCLVLEASLPVARRPPAALYELVHECWRRALAHDFPDVEPAPSDLPFPAPHRGPFFCFEKPGRTDLIYRGAKLLGSAQRRIPGRVLQHGSLLLGRTFAAHPGASLGDPPPHRVQRWVDAFVANLARALADAAGSTPPAPFTPHTLHWSRRQLADVEARRRRYASPEWTQLR